MNAAAMAGNGGTVAKKIASEVDRQYILAQEGPPASPSRESLPAGAPLLPLSFRQAFT